MDAYGALTGISQALDTYTGESEVDDTIPIEGEGEADTWYTMSELASNAERLHYGEGGINPATGNYSVTCTDLSVPAPGFTVNISRSYNSRNERQTLLGRGWTFGFEGKMTNKTDSIEVSLPNGSSHEFKLVNGSYVGVNTRAKFIKNVTGAAILTTTDQYQYGFDPTSNMMTYMQDKNGNRINLTYTSGKLTTITDTAGRDYLLTYNDSSLLASVTDPAGRVVTYTYNADNLLAKVTDPEGGSLKYEYDSSQYLTKQIDQKEYTFQQLTYSHDMGAAENKVIESKDAAGQTWNYSYDLSASSTTITDAGSKKWTYWYNYYYDTVKMQDPEGKFTVTEYDYPTDPNNNYYSDVKARVDRNGNRTEYVVDQATGNVTKVTNPDLSFKTFTYDQWNNVVKEVNEKGSITYYIYDSTGARLLKKAQPLNGTDNYVEGNTTAFAVTSYTYYTKSEAHSLFDCEVEGLQKTVTDPEGNTTTYTYNSFGDIASTKDAAGNITTDTYDAVGQKVSETMPTGFTTQWKYDKNGKVIREIHPDGGVKRYVYDAVGNTTLEVNPNQYSAALDNTTTEVYSGTIGTSYEWYTNGYLNSVTDAEGNRTVYTWDSYGNKATETKPNGAVYQYVYDSLNRLTKTYFKESTSGSEVLLSEISYGILDNGNSQISKTEYADSTHKYTTVTVKDYADREVEVQNPDGGRIITTYNPDGTIGQKTAANGAITYYSYDSLGNMTDVWKPMSVVDGNAKYSWTGYSYDKAGKLLTEKTGKTLTAWNGTAENVYEKQYQYVKGLLKQETDSDGRKTEYSYNGDNRISELTQTVSQAETQKTTTTYNYRGQVLTVTKQVRAGDISTYDYTNDSILNYSSSYLYDKNGNMTSYTDPAGIVAQYTYDKLDRLLSTTRYLKSGSTVVSSTTVSQTYTWDGQIASKTDARGNTTSYTYDAQGNQTMITDALTKVTLKDYDLLGRNTAIVSPKNYEAGKLLSNLERTEFVYDSMNRVVAQKELYYKLIPDGAGNLNREWADVTVKEYEYDSLGNITSEKDALGNTKTTVYNLAGLEEYETDAETKDRGLPFTVSYAYNGLGQKVKETYQDIVYTYEYDGAGNLLCTKADDVTKSSMEYDFLGRAVQLTDARGNVTTQKWNALGKLSKVVKPDGGTTTCQYDLLGNTIYLKNNSAVTVYAYDYLGRTLSCTVKNLAGDVTTDTSYIYDQNGNIVEQKDGNKKTTYFTYDALNRKETEINPKLQKTAYTYDANGNELTKEDYLGNTITKVYDGINRFKPYGGIE